MKLDKHNRLSVRVRAGSALERLIKLSQAKTASAALHDLAAAHEAYARQALSPNNPAVQAMEGDHG